MVFPAPDAAPSYGSRADKASLPNVSGGARMCAGPALMPEHARQVAEDRHGDEQPEERDEAGEVDDVLDALVHAPARHDLVDQEHEPAAVERRQRQEVEEA